LNSIIIQAQTYTNIKERLFLSRFYKYCSHFVHKKDSFCFKISIAAVSFKNDSIGYI